MRTTAKQVAKRLSAMGFPILSHVEPDYDEDGMVEVTDEVHVQVGFDYVGVVSESGGEFTFYSTADTYETLANDLRRAMNP